MRLERKGETPSLADETPFVIYNPAARGERARGLREKIQKLDPRAVVRPTGGPGDAAALAATAIKEGFRTIVAAGGDGTINEVVNGIAGSDATLGLLPVGTMNVFATEMGVPGNRLKRAWEIIEAGHVRRVDLAQVNSHYFIQLAGIGFDAQAVAGVDWSAKKTLGPLSYIISAAKVAARPPPRLRITSGAKEWEGSFVLVGNGRHYGGPFVVFKDARIDDGLLDVLIFKSQGHLDIIRYVQHVLMGTHLGLHDVEHFQAAALEVQSIGGEEVPFEADGELVGYAPASIRISKERLGVIVPRFGG